MSTKVIIKRTGEYSYKNYVWPRRMHNKKCWNCFSIKIIEPLDLWYYPNCKLWSCKLDGNRQDFTIVSNSMKSVIRHIRKWNLPVKTEGIILGNYIGEEWKFTIK